MGESRDQHFHSIPLVDLSATLFSSLPSHALRCGDIDLAYRKFLITAPVEWKVELAGRLHFEFLHERVEFWDRVVSADLNARGISQGEQMKNLACGLKLQPQVIACGCSLILSSRITL